MSIESFFTRPGSRCEISERIKSDIKYAKQRIMGALYFLTEHEVIEEINNSRVAIKRFILNQCEKNNLKDSQVVYIGNIEGKETIFHHKFIIIDDVLWVGSYNLSSNASKFNWENVLRISEPDIIVSYLNEFNNIFLFAHALKNDIWKYTPADESKKDICNFCRDNKCFKHSLIKCNLCGEKVEDPFLHHKMKVSIVSDIEEYYEDCDEGEYLAFTSSESNYRVKDYELKCVNILDKTKGKCSCCNQIALIESLNIIEYFNDVGKYLHCEDQMVFENEKLTGTIPIHTKFEEEKSRSKNMIEKLCWDCLYKKLDDYWNKL